MEDNNANIEPELNNQGQKKKGHKKTFLFIIISLLVIISIAGAIYGLIEKKKREDGQPIEIVDKKNKNERQDYYLLVAFSDDDKNIFVEKLKTSKEEYEDSQITAFNLAREKGYSFVGV